MVRSNKKAKRTGVDFKKVKHKVGRRLPPPKNATNVEIKSKAIILREQSLALEKSGLAVNKKQQTLKELLMQTTHHNANVRKDALNGIKDLFIRHPKEIKLHKLAIIEKLSPRISDADKSVRETLFALFKLVVFPGLEEASMGPLVPIIMAHIFNAMTQLAMNIRLMAFKFLDLVVQHYQSTIVANYSAKVLENYADILGKTGGFSQDKGKLMDLLAGLVHYLSSLHSSTQTTKSSPNKQVKSKIVTLHGYKCIVPKKVTAVVILNNSGTGISGLVESLQALVPVLLEGWAECSPSVCSMPNPDNACLECTGFILQAFNLIFKCIKREPYDSNELSHVPILQTMQMDEKMQTWVKAIYPFLVDRLLSLFPLSPLSESSQKVQEKFVALNTGVCEVALEITHWVGIGCLPREKIFQYIENCLEGQVLPTYHKRSIEKHIVPLVGFMPRLILLVTNGWKERLLKAFTRAFLNCNKISNMKLSCLSSVEQMLLHDIEDTVLQAFQSEWICSLPKLLWELRHENPDASRLVLQILLHIGRSANEHSVLCKEYTELQPVLMPFFSMHVKTQRNKVKVVYGPFVKLRKDCQELAIDSLYYYSSFSPKFLESLAHCCLNNKLDITIVARLIQVVQRAFCRGCIRISDQLSFLLTLIVSCKVIHDNPQISSTVGESDPDSSIEFGKYKVVTRIVCVCLSEVGDESIVLGLIQPTIFEQLAHKPPLDITCALLRMVVVLSTRTMQLPSHFVHGLPQYIYQYLIDIGHVCIINEGAEKSNICYPYYILPCIFLFSRSEKLTRLVFDLLESSSREGSVSKSSDAKHICAVAWVVIQFYKIEHVHCRLLACESSTKAILKNMNLLQASQSIKISGEERDRLMKFYSQLKVTTSALHKWKEE